MDTATKILTALGPRYRHDEGSLTRVLVDAWGAKLNDALADGDAAVAQLSTLTASARWLDQWGLLYAIMRQPQELDDAYASRLISETIRQRPQPFALEQIIRGAFDNIDFLYVRDLWPFVLLSDQWVSPPGKPKQVSDGQLDETFLDFGPSMATVSFSPTHAPGSFGIWVSESTSELLTYTLQEVINLLPLVLLSDQSIPTSHVSDGQLTTPDFGGPSDTARHSFSLPVPVFPASIDDIMALINQHRAAGTRPIMIATQLRPVTA